MASNNLLAILEQEGGAIPDDLSDDAVDRILRQPEQEALAEAVVADLVDAAPLVGDLLALVRIRRAEERGIEYPERPSGVENVLSDIPAPLDTVGDIIISQNTLQYLEQKYGVELAERQEEMVDNVLDNVDETVGDITPGN